VSDQAGEGGNLPLVLIVAPATGKLHILPPQNFVDGQEWVDKGQVVALVEHSNADADEIKAPIRGRMGGMMGRDGEPVRQGQPVAWMEALPEGQTIMKPLQGGSAEERGA
jgi:acetyl/propionyl-CoA carboxylase alpha subunit